MNIKSLVCTGKRRSGTATKNKMMGNRKKTSTSIDSEEDTNQRRSTRCRERVTYCDNLSDHEDEDTSKRFKGVGYPSPTKVQHLSLTEHRAGS